MENSNKNAHLSTGFLGEDLAVAFLLKKGFILYERNWRHHRFEVDIIAQHNNVLHFIEVKTLRGNKGALPESKVNHAKLNRLKQAAEGYLYENPQWKFIQFDIVAITLQQDSEPDIFFIEDIF